MGTKRDILVNFVLDIRVVGTLLGYKWGGMGVHLAKEVVNFVLNIRVVGVLLGCKSWHGCTSSQREVTRVVNLERHIVKCQLHLLIRW